MLYTYTVYTHEVGILMTVSKEFDSCSLAELIEN